MKLITLICLSLLSLSALGNDCYLHGRVELPLGDGFLNFSGTAQTIQTKSWQQCFRKAVTKAQALPAKQGWEAVYVYWEYNDGWFFDSYGEVDWETNVLAPAVGVQRDE